MQVAAGTLLLCLCLTAPALAWSQAGHRLTAWVAEQRMSPQLRREVERLLRHHPEREFRSLELASVWPDYLRDRDREKAHSHWHYINLTIPEGAGLPAPENVVWAIEHNRRILADRRRPLVERAVALSWVAHLVGDVHMPLHCATRYSEQFPQGDRGGNLLFILTGTVRMPLHTYWDRTGGYFLDDPPRHRFLRTGHDLLARYRPPAASGPADWARESHDLAVTVVYPGVQFDQPLSPEYVAQARKVALERVALGGDRLHALLREALTKR